LKQGRIIRGYLGIEANQPQPGQPKTDTEGVVVANVIPDSPAAQAQLQKGDIISKFNGHAVRSLPELRNLVSQVELNKNIELEVVRNGNPMKVTAAIKEQPVDYQATRVVPRQDQPQESPQPAEPVQSEGGLRSIQVGDLIPEMVRQLDLPNGVRGVVVTKVDPDSGVADLQKGDVIEEVNQQPVSSVAEYNKIVGSLDSNQTLVLSVCRHRARSFIVLRPR
jgi:serine protease Do